MRAVSRLDDADLREAAGKLRRRADHVRQAARAFRQRRVVACRQRLAPMGGRSAVERRVEVFAEGGAQRRLEAAIDLHLLQHGREQAAGAGIEDARQRARLGLDALQPRARLLHGRPLRGLASPRVGDRLLGGERGLLGCGHRRVGRLGQRLLLQRIGQRCDAAGDARRLVLDLGKLALDARQALIALAQAALGLRAQRGSVGALGRQPRQRRLAQRQPRFGILEGGAGARLGLGGTRVGRAQLGLLGGEPRKDLVIVAQHLPLALDVGVELGDTLLELGLAGAHARRLLLELAASDGEPLQGRRGGSLGVAQFGQALGGDRLVLGGLHLLGGALADQRGGDRERRLRLALLLLGLRPADVQQGRLGLADVGRQVLEAGRLAGLPLQILDLALQLADHVVQPLEVLLGGAQAQFRLVAACVQAGDAGRLLQQGAAGLRLGLDQLADTPLPDHRGRAGAGRLVGEEKLHVLGARLAAVDAVDGAGLALDAAGDLQFLGLVEGGRRRAVGIVEEKRHLGGVAGGPCGGAGEDDVVHAGRAHVLVGALAHHPAQRLDEVRLAAAIGADDAGQATLDDEFGRVDEGFEAEEAQPVELHARVPARGRAPSAAGRSRKAASGDAVDDRRHLVNRESPRILVAVDEEGGRGIHAELLRAAVPHSPDIVQKLLVRQAGLELLL